MSTVFEKAWLCCAAIHEALSLSTRPQRLDVCSLESHCRSEQGGSEGDESNKTRPVLAAQPLLVRNRAKYAGHHGAAAAARHYSRDNEQTRETILGRWPMVFLSFLTTTVYLSCMFRGCPPDYLINVVATNAQISSILVLHDIVGSTCDSEPTHARE